MLLYSISDCIAIFLESSEIAPGLSKSSTAFLMLVKHLVTPIIITHHALTMSRMHRLYGVTMAEQGVSQLVSVDLQKAEELVA